MIMCKDGSELRKGVMSGSFVLWGLGFGLTAIPNAGASAQLPSLSDPNADAFGLSDQLSYVILSFPIQWPYSFC